MDAKIRLVTNPVRPYSKPYTAQEFEITLCAAGLEPGPIGALPYRSWAAKVEGIGEVRYYSDAWEEPGWSILGADGRIEHPHAWAEPTLDEALRAVCA